ncbi:PLxRFG domain-containing protein [Alicycliphilus denitrificans]|uniref:PLxRFG domain-containing protein n=1 Tax=Alicycliphilus denitrificans TaxID=179636 RepID=UPI0011AEC89C|nr:PLxRFG domain-containing protein [Alicycliphilus denitrificans]
MTDAKKPWEQQYGGGAADGGAEPWNEDYGPDADKAPAAPRGLKGWAQDVAATAVKGAIGVPEALVGLADIPTGGAVGKFLENEGGAVGLRFKQAKEVANDWHSDATKEAQRKFQAADGIVDKTVTAIQNPSLIATAVGESLPSMGAGGVAARGLLAAAPRVAPWAAGAIGEGVTGAGSAAEQIRQETKDGLLTPEQAALAGATGVATTAFGALGGKVANRLGIGEADTMLAQGMKGLDKQAADTAARAAANPLVADAAVKSIPRKVIEGAISEGFLEELPQSMAEQIFQNVALDKPWYEDLDSAAVMGVLSGGAMGAGASGFHGLHEAAARGKQGGAPAPGDAAPADLGAPPAAPNAGLERVSNEFAARLKALQEQEQGEPQVPQAAPPDGAAALARQQAQAQAERDAQIAAGRAMESPDDEIYQSTGATTPRPSEAMGLRPGPAAGTLENAAALAVDTGASAEVQQATMLAQAAEDAKKAKPADQKKERESTAAQAVDPNTGEISDTSVSQWSDADLSTAFRAAQSKDVRRQLAQELSRRRANREEDALQAELRAEQAAASMPDAPDSAFARVQEDAGAVPDRIDIQGASDAARAAPGSKAEGASVATLAQLNRKQLPDLSTEELNQLASLLPADHGRQKKIQKELQTRAKTAQSAINEGAKTNGAETTQAQQGSAQPAQAGAAPGGAVAGQGAGLEQAGAAPAAAAQGLTNDAARAQRAQRLDDAGAAWTRMPVADRQAITARLDGVKPVLAKNLPRAQWENLNGDIKLKIAAAIAPQVQAEAAPVTVRSAGPGATAKPAPAAIPRQAVVNESLTTERQDAQTETAAVTAAAHEAATSHKNDLPAPTEAQIEAGNYKKGHVRLNGLDISIENPAGSRRRPEWPPLKNHYGYFKGSVGADKDHVDVFMTNRAADPDLPVFVVDQVNEDGSFDEHKVVMGAADEAGARATYLGNYERGWTGLGAITQMTQDEFKAWVRDPTKTKKRAAPALAPREAAWSEAEEKRLLASIGRTGGVVTKDMDGHFYAEVAVSNNDTKGVRATGKTSLAAKRALLAKLEAEATAASAPAQAPANMKDADKINPAISAVRAYVDGDIDKAALIEKLRPLGLTEAQVDSVTMKLEEDFTADDIRAVLASPAPAPQPSTTVKKKPSADQTRAKADLMNALADLGDILGKGTRLNMMPEQEQKLLPVLTRVLDAAFRLGYHKFKDAAKFSLDQIREHLGAAAADALTLDHLQGAYIAMAGGKQGVDTKRAVIDIEDKAEIEAHNATPAEPETDTMDEAPAGADQNGETGNERADIRGDGPQALGQVAAAEGGRVEGERGTGASPADGRQGNAAAGAGPNGAGLPAARSGGSGAPAVRPAQTRARHQPGAVGAQGNSRAGARVPEDDGRVAVPGGEASAPNIPAADFQITDDVELGKGGEVQKFNDNLAAIRALKHIEAEGRRASPDEQALLARYVGWGGLASAFPDPISGNFKDKWKERGEALRDLLTKEEYAAARRSTRNAHYTSQTVVSAMWDMVRRLGYRGGLVLESSMGTGNFLGLAPKDMANRFVGVEYDSLTARIGQALYPQATVLHSGFQKVPVADNAFMLNIGNPPFGSESLRFQFKPELQGVSIHNQFFRAGMDALRPGGLQAMVVSRFLMDAQDKSTRLALAQQAKLVAAFRLPDTAFKENARTDVVTDILIFQKLDAGAQAAMEAAVAEYRKVAAKKKDADTAAAALVPAWVETVQVPDPLGGEAMTVNAYFRDNARNVLGVLERSGSTQHGADITVRLDRPAELGALLREAVARLPENIQNFDQQVLAATAARHKSMSDALRIAVANEEAGHVKRTPEGLLRVIERETPEGDYELAYQPINEASPWHDSLSQDASGKWYVLEQATDAEGNKLKALGDDGKETRRNLYERKVFDTPADVPEKMRLGKLGMQRLEGLVGLRDLLKRQLVLETADAAQAVMEGNRKALAKAYEAFVKANGPVNRSTNLKMAMTMPDGGLVAALEVGYQPARTAEQAARSGLPAQKEQATAAPILRERVVPKYEPATKAATASDALAITLAERGRVDMERIASLLGVNQAEAAQQLQQGDEPLVFQDPETQTWETADAYLSGLVKRKLNAARAAGMAQNVQALERVIPADWTAENVTVTLGGTWVPADVYADFVQHLAGGKARVSFSPLTNSFNVSLDSSDRAAMANWSTEGAPVDYIVSRVLNSKAVTVTGRDADGNTYIDKEKTALAGLKAREIEAEFGDWVFKDGDRRQHLVGIFNEKFNTRVVRQFNGQHLQLPGKVPDTLIKMRRHQMNAIWRGIYERFMLVDHAVGAGKTFTAIARAMERRRMGLSRKPMIVVPNHLVEQWEADVYRLYPGAKVLAAGKKDFEAKRRRRLFGKIATGDWDIVIVPHSSFGFIGIAPETESRYLQLEMAQAQAAIEDAWQQAREDGQDGGRRKPFGVKEAERLAEKIQGRMDRLAEGVRDRLLTFEQLGVDDMTVDEAHEFKNLYYSSNLTGVRGMGDKTGSRKANDLYNKVRVLREQPTGSVTFLTGTPISNSAVEMFTMLRYLAADSLEEMGLTHFDAFRAQFVEATPAFEPTESGRLKQVTRLGRTWSNMRSLMDLYYQVTDAVSLDDIKRFYAEDNDGAAFPVPKIAGGKDRQLVTIKPTPAQDAELKAVMASFDGLEDIKDPYERNAERLRLMDRARKLSLDIRAVDPRSASQEEGGKLQVVSENVKRIYDKWRDDKGTQLVFLDRSVPKAKGDDKIIREYDALLTKRSEALRVDDQEAFDAAQEALDRYDSNEIAELRLAQTSPWSAYQQIKDNLIAAGIPADEIRFVQEANNDEQKAALFDAVNGGKVRVLIGSTPRMGAGTNVQQRVVGLHHVDVTWKPSDIEQREGRAIRQGNELLAKYGDDFEVELLAYATERTTDAKMWDLNATKLRTINGIRKYTGAFTMEFEDEEAVGMAEMAALASGNPMLLERVKVESEIQTLELQERAHRRKMWGVEDELRFARQAIKDNPGRIEAAEQRRTQAKDAIAALEAEQDARSVTIEGKAYGTVKDAFAAAEAIVKDQQGGNDKARYAVTINGRRVTTKDGISDQITAALGDVDPFAATVGGKVFTQRTAAAREAAERMNQAMKGQDELQNFALGEMLGYQLVGDLVPMPMKDGATVYEPSLTLMDGDRTVASHSGNVQTGDLTATNLRGLLQSLVNDIYRNARSTDPEYLARQMAQAERDLPALEARKGEGFPKAQELATKRARLAELVTLLEGKQQAEPTTEAQAEADENPDEAHAGVRAAPADTFAAEVMAELAAVDELFQNPVVRAGSAEAALRQIDPSVKFVGDVTAEDERQESGADTKLMFRTAKGRDFYVYEKGNELWLDVSRLDEGDGGNAIYAALMDYAASEGKVFIGDPTGLSDVAMRRRLEAMISSAIKHGSTDHMEPHARQVEGDEKLGIPALQWRGGDTIGNIQRMIDVSLASIAAHVPEFRRARYDFTTGTFRNSQGAPLSDEVLRGWASKFGRVRAAGAGERTLKRGILLNTLARTESSQRPGLLEQALRQPRQLVGEQAKGIFYKGGQARAASRTSTGTPTDRAIMDMVGEGRDAASILRMIAGTSRSPFNRKVARLLTKTGAAPAVALSQESMGGADGFTFLAKYSRKNDTLTLTPGAQAQAEHIFMHEMIHAATLRALDRKGLASLQMRRLYEHVKRQSGAAGQYGMKNVGEFVAEAFTNPAFQRALRKMEAPSGSTLKTAWDGFVRILRSILGLQQDSTDALSKALELGVAVMGEDKALRGRGARGQGAAPAEDAAHFGAADFNRLKSSAIDQITQTFTHPGKVSLWDKTVGTMRHLGERVPQFKPVFDAAQRFIDDVSMLANDAADAAPRLMPRVETLADLKKKPITAADNKAVAKPLFEGTLMWARDLDGEPVTTEALNDKYRNASADEKAQILLRTGKIQPQMLKVWQGQPLDRFEAIINNKFESTILKPGIVWSAKELKTLFGLSDGQVSLYQEARAAIDRSIDMTARTDMLRLMGEAYAPMREAVLGQPTLRDAFDLVVETLQGDARENEEQADRLLQISNQVVTRHETANELMDHGYAPLSRFGRYTVDVVDQGGERQYFGMFESQREANQMKLKMASVFPGAAITQGTMSQQAFKLFQGITPESLEQFGEMLGLSGSGGEAKDKAFQAYLQLAKNNHSALKRLIHRKGIDGYSEDVGRVLASFVYSNARLGSGGLNAGTMEKAVESIPKEMGELRDVAMGLRSYIQDPQEEGQAVRGMLFAQYLGGSAASAMVNMTQPFQITMPWLSQYGGMKQAAGQMARALNDMRKSWTDKNFQYEPDLAKALQDAVDDGTVSPQEIHQLMAQARGTGSLRTGDGTRLGDARATAANNWERVKVAWGQPFALAEQFNRRSTFIAAYRTAKERGMESPAEFARKAVLETQFLYSKANKPKWARGAIGGTLFTFKTYSVSYLELMHRMWTQGGPEGKRAVGWSVAMLLLMAGAGGLPFMEDAEDLIDGAGQLMGYNFSTKQARKEFLSSIVGKELSEFMEQGITGLPGMPVDVGGRLGMQNLIPGTGLALEKKDRMRDLLEIAGPAGDLVARGFSGAREAIGGVLKGDASALGRAALEVAPTAVRNAFKGADMAASGIYKDTKGYKVMDVTLDEALAKMVGFQPKSVAEDSEATGFKLRTKSFYIQQSSEIKAQWADALFRKDEDALQRVRDRLAAWNRNNPDLPITVKIPDIMKKVREMGKDRTQRIADTAPKALRQQMREMAAEVR